MKTQPVESDQDHAGSQTDPDRGETRQSFQFLTSSWPRALGFGALGGLLWGTVLRAWMRFISTDPEFTWGGTIAILTVSALAGGALTLARRRRRLGGVGWWRLTFITLILLGAGGAVMWPTVVLWAIAMGRKRPWWLVTLLLGAGAAAQVPVIQDAIYNNWRLEPMDKALATIWYAPMIAIQAWAFSVAFSRAADGAVAPPRVTRTLIGVAIGAAAIVFVLAVGNPM